MAKWIKVQDKHPEPHQHILATITENGKPMVIACWYCEGLKIQIKERPHAQTFSFSIVHAWMPFPEPYVEEEKLVEVVTI